MDSSNSIKLPVFVCRIKQKGNVVVIKVPFGSLENMIRALPAHNGGTSIEVLYNTTLDI